MNKKIIPVVLIALISISLVYATMTGSEDGPYDVEIELQEGWNIIAGTVLEDGISSDSEIQLGDIEVMWYYSPLQKKYIQTYPNADWEGINQDDEDFVLNSAMWIYSNKKGTIKYSTLEEYPPLNQRQLYAGWNFVTITSNMDGSSIDDFKGSCELEDVYTFRPSSNNWYSFSTDEPISLNDEVGYGLLFKISNDCTLGTPSGGTSPPPLPNGNGGTTGYILTNIPGFEDQSPYETTKTENGITFGYYEGNYYDIKNNAYAEAIVSVFDSEADAQSILSASINEMDEEGEEYDVEETATGINIYSQFTSTGDFMNFWKFENKIIFTEERQDDLAEAYYEEYGKYS